MNKNDINQNLIKIAEAIGMSILPPPINGLVSGIREIKEGKDLEEKLDNLRHSTQIMPVSIEVEYVSVVIIYFNPGLNQEKDTKDIEADLHELQDSEYYFGVSDFVITENFVALNLFEPTYKDDVQKNTIEVIRELLSEHDIKIKAIAYV